MVERNQAAFGWSSAKAAGFFRLRPRRGAGSGRQTLLGDDHGRLVGPGVALDRIHHEACDVGAPDAAAVAAAVARAHAGPMPVMQTRRRTDICRMASIRIRVVVDSSITLRNGLSFDPREPMTPSHPASAARVAAASSASPSTRLASGIAAEARSRERTSALTSHFQVSASRTIPRPVPPVAPITRIRTDLRSSSCMTRTQW